MADTTPNPAPDPNQSIAQPPPRKKRRLWLKIPLALLILLLLFVLLLPTILSTGMARRFALGQANKNLNGHVEVADWSIGWTGGINAQGIKVFDDAGKQVVQLDHFSTELPLTSAMFGKLHLGKVKIDGLSFDLKADEQGKLNVAKVAKPSNPNEPAPPPAKPSSGKLPDISADVQISNVHGTFTQPGKPAVAVTKLDGNIKIPDINQPITNDFNVGLKVGNGPEGSIKTSGTADVIKDNKVALDTANVQQTVTVNNVDLAAAKPFLAGTGIEDVAGQLGANLALDVKGGKDATLDANVNAGNITAAGPALKGDTFTTKTFTVAVPKLSAAFPQGLDHWQSGRIKAGADAGSAPIAVKLDQAQVTATLDVTPQALLNLKDNARPGSTGKIAVNSNVDLGALAGQLKNSIGLSKDVAVTSGKEASVVNIDLTDDRATLATTTDITDVKGTRAGKPIALQPIHLEAGAADLGGGGKVPDVRDLKLILNSAFATADFHGAGIANLAGDLKGQLQKVQSELGQFVDFGGKQYAGDFDVAIANNGDLTSPGGTAHASTTATLTNLKLGDDVNQPWVQAAFKADLHRGNPEFVDTVKNILVTLQSGNPQSPTVDVYATANADLTGAAKADFHLSRANIDLVKARAEFTKMFPPDLFISGGNVAMTADGAYDGAAKRADITAVTLAARDATIQRQASDGRRVDLLHNYTLNMNTAARADLSNGMAVQVPKLSVTDSQQMQLNVTDVDLQLSKPTSPGQPAAEQNPLDKLRSAKLALLVPDLKQLQALANTFSQSSAPAPSPVDPKAAPPTTQPLPPLEITSGSLAMHADVSHSGSALALNVSDITGKDIAFHRGDVAYQVKPITMQLAASVEPGDGKTTTKPIQKIQVTQLSGNLGVATLSMPTPIVVTGLDAASPSANGGIKIDGHLQDVTQLLAALQAKTADAYPYRGDFAVTENIGSSASGINVNGGVNVAKFQVLKGNDVQFAEDQLVLANDVSMASDYNSVAIKNVSANMQSSGALNVALRNGTVDDLKSARRMNLGVDLQYDLAKLWPIIHPMLLTPGQEDQYKDLKLAGQFKKVIVLKGQYPTDVPMQQAIRQLSADADLAVGLFDYNGMHIENLDVPISLRDGKASTIYADKPTGQNAAPPAVANQGKLDLSNITIDLTQDPPLISTPPNKALLSHATINPLFADKWLNKVINNPVFVGAKQATGLVDVTIVSCDKLPASKIVMQQVPQNRGTATVKFSLTELHIGGEGVGKALGKVMAFINKDNGNQQFADSFPAEVKDATISLANGVATQHINFQSGRYNIGFDGSVNLQSQQMLPLTVNLPGSAVAHIFTSDPNVLKAVPAQVSMIMTGPITSPQVQWDQVAQKLVNEAAPNLIGNLISKKLNKGKNPADANNPNSPNPTPDGANQQPQKPEDAVIDLLKKTGVIKDNPNAAPSDAQQQQQQPPQQPAPQRPAPQPRQPAQPPPQNSQKPKPLPGPFGQH